MIFFDIHNKAIYETVLSRLNGTDSDIDLDIHLSEFDDVRYRIEVGASNQDRISLSISLPVASGEALGEGGLPLGAKTSLKEILHPGITIKEEADEGFNLTLVLDLKNASGYYEDIARQLSSIRSIILGAPLRTILTNLFDPNVSPSPVTAVAYRPDQKYFVIPKEDKVTVIYPMHFSDSNDVVIATAFLLEMAEAGRGKALMGAPVCNHCMSPPLEIKGLDSCPTDANAGFISFVIFPHHVEGKKLSTTVWMLSTFYAYVSYHVKCSKAFMHTRMRRRVDSLIETLSKARINSERGEKKSNRGLVESSPQFSPRKDN